MRRAEIQLVRNSFLPVERQAHVAALLFYRRLFALDPSLRQLFQADIEGQARKLMEMLGATLDLLEQPTRLNAVLEQLGARHSGYGVRDAHYEAVGEALLGMLGDVLGDGFTPEVSAAWLKLYSLVATSMKRGAVHSGSSANVAGRRPPVVAPASV